MLLIRVLPRSWDQMKYLLPRNNKGKGTSSMIFTALVFVLALVKPMLQAWRKPCSIFTTSLLSAAGREDFLPESQPAENDAVAQIMLFFSSNCHNFQWSRNSTTFFLHGTFKHEANCSIVLNGCLKQHEGWRDEAGLSGKFSGWKTSESEQQHDELWLVHKDLNENTGRS